MLKATLIIPGSNRRGTRSEGDICGLALERMLFGRNPVRMEQSDQLNIDINLQKENTLLDLEWMITIEKIAHTSTILCRKAGVVPIRTNE